MCAYVVRAADCAGVATTWGRLWPCLTVKHIIKGLLLKKQNGSGAVSLFFKSWTPESDQWRLRYILMPAAPMKTSSD